jgi:hypothetical protein
MTDDVIKRLKICLKDEGTIFISLKNIPKSELLKNIRINNKKLTDEFYFCDGEDKIGLDLEEQYDVGEIVDSQDKIYIKKTAEVSNNVNNSKSSEKKEEDNNKCSEEVKQFVNSLTDKESLRQNCFEILIKNGIETMKDLLSLSNEDIETFGFQLVFKKKFIEELNKLKPKELLSQTEKVLIKTLNEKDTTISEIYTFLQTTEGTEKGKEVKKFFDSIQKEIKPIPTNLPELFVKIKGDKLPCYKYPSHKLMGKRYFTLLVMGETGSGKTTLMDAFVNYLAGINYGDLFRYKLVDENAIKDRPSEESQTSEITDYYINYAREDGREINIHLIDTPGLGDTKGVLEDNNIIKKFEELFKKIGELDYILITVKATTTRWTQGTSYIYDRILEVFGKDAMERFMLMCTFADGAIPPCIDVLKGKLTYQEYFTFNNSALYVPKIKSNDNVVFFWKLGMSNVKRFFDVILDNNYLPLSLTMSKKVMENRQWLYANVESSKERIDNGFRLLDEANDLLEAIKKNKKLLDENGSFEYEVEVEVTKKVKLPKAIQYCKNCQCLCCQVCEWPEDSPISKCTYFNWESTGYRCPKCPGKCQRMDHQREAYGIKKEYVKEKRIYEAQKELHEEGKKGLSISEMALNDVVNKMIDLGKKILVDMQSIKTSLEELEKIALKPRLFTNEQYFIDMIKFEEEAKSPGYQKRIEGLKIMQNQAKRINDLSKSNDLTSLFPQFKSTIAELKNKKSNISCAIF